MEPAKLRKFLSRFKVFPDRHRALVYKHLLRLPNNFEAYDNLVRRGVHSAYVHLNVQYPISNHALFTKTQRILSALAHFCPVFGEVEYLPALAFPFIKLFGTDEVLCFEVVLSFLAQFSQHFFEFFPNAPIALLQAVDDLLKHHDA